MTAGRTLNAGAAGPFRMERPSPRRLPAGLGHLGADLVAVLANWGEVRREWADMGNRRSLGVRARRLTRADC